MDIRIMRKLEKLGFDKDWLTVIKREWKPKKKGQYDMLITYIEDLSDDPLNGVRIECTKFNNDYDLSVIHKYFEGNAYVIVDMSTNKIISSGILDDGVFDEMQYYTMKSWELYDESELAREQEVKRIHQESIINRLTRENLELELEIAKLKMELKKYQKLEE